MQCFDKETKLLVSSWTLPSTPHTKDNIKIIFFQVLCLMKFLFFVKTKYRDKNHIFSSFMFNEVFVFLLKQSIEIKIIFFQVLYCFKLYENLGLSKFFDCNEP